MLSTRSDAAVVFVRLALGVVMFAHGAQKLLGWFGGPGFAATLKWFAANFGIPSWLAVIVICIEFFGGLGVFFGFLTRLSALAIGTEMGVAVALVHWHYGFFMNWFGNKAGEGYEFHVLVVGIALALLIRGGGSLSIDRALAKSRGR